MTPEQQAQATCPHPREYLHLTQAWGPRGPLSTHIRCTLCGTTS